MATSSCDWHAYEALGRRVRVRDSWAVGVRLVELACDPCFTAEEAGAIALRMVVVDPEGFARAFGERAPEALCSLLWQAFRIDADGTHGSEGARVLVDPLQDAARIRVTMRMAYGYGREETDALPFRDVCEMVGMAPADTPMGQALHYRTAKRPKATRHNRAEVRAFDRAREHYRLRRYRDPAAAYEEEEGRRG